MSAHDDATQGDALVAIANEDMGALKLLGDLMEHNARDSAWALEQAYEGEKREHERTKERLREAHDRLDTIHQRVAWLLGVDAWEES